MRLTNNLTQALAVTGGQDKTINAYDITSAMATGTSASLLPEYTLLGHEDNVCALDVYSGSNGYIVSGSWDRTARVWKDWSCMAILAGHTQAVWAVLALSDDLVLTGEHSSSAGCMLRQLTLFSLL
jgi:phospholipase A-2-activating protein